MDSARNFLLPKPSIVICIASLLLASVILAVGQTENVVHRFQAGRDGAYPSSGLISDKAGNFYGVTEGGKQSGNGGTVFRLSPPNEKGGRWAVTTLHIFGNNNHGANPTGELIFDQAGNLYGTTPSGGPENSSTVFELKRRGGAWREAVIYVGGSTYAPVAGLSSDKAGGLYFATYSGGEDDYGSVFQLMPSENGDWKAIMIYSFTGGNEAYPPAGPIISGEGNLFGVLDGNGGNSYGAVYELKAPPTRAGGWAGHVLYEFNGGTGDAAYPRGRPVFDGKGNLYGVADGGAYGAGAVFKLTRQGDSWTESVIYSFCAQNSCTDGSDPSGGLILDEKGNLYGTTEFGGNGGCDYGCGTVFKLAPPTQGGTWAETVLHNFTGEDGDGYQPYTPLAFGKLDSLWGTTFLGGKETGRCQDQQDGPGCGIVFSVRP